MRLVHYFRLRNNLFNKMEKKKRSFAWTPIKQILNPNPMTLLSSIELGFPHCMETWDLPQVQRSHMFQSPGSHAKLRAKWNTTRLCDFESFCCKSMSNLFRSKKRFPVLCISVTRFFRHCAQSMAGASGKKLVTGTRLIHLDGLHCHKFCSGSIGALHRGFWQFSSKMNRHWREQHLTWWGPLWLCHTIRLKWLREMMSTHVNTEKKSWRSHGENSCIGFKSPPIMTIFENPHQ